MEKERRGAPAAVTAPEIAAISETPEQMNQRLCGVIARARFTVLAQPHAWQPLARSAPFPASAIAAVRDGGGMGCSGAYHDGRSGRLSHLRLPFR